MNTQLSPAGGQPLFAGQKKSMMSKIGGALAGAALLGGAAMAAPASADTFTASKPVAGITQVQATPADQQETLGQLGKELGDSFVALMQIVGDLAKAENIDGADRLQAAIAASREAGKGMEGIDLSKELDEAGQAAVRNYVNTVFEQSAVFDEVINANPAFVAKLQEQASNPDSDMAKAGERLATILQKVFG
jgi:hypothetical protein